MDSYTLSMSLDDLVYCCFTAKLTAPADARYVCDSWRSCFLYSMILLLICDSDIHSQIVSKKYRRAVIKSTCNSRIFVDV